MTWALIGFLMEPGVPALTGSQQGVKIVTRVIGPITDRQIVGDVFMGSLLRWTTLCQRTMVRRRLVILQVRLPFRHHLRSLGLPRRL